MNVTLSLFALVAWLALHVVVRKDFVKGFRLLLLPFSVALAFFFWTTGISWFDSIAETASNIPHLTLAVLATCASEAVIWFYVDHRNSLLNPFALFPVTLRLGLIAILTALLMEPVLSHFEEHSSIRTIAVLLDRSASMNLSDRKTIADGGESEQNRIKVAHKILLGGQQENSSLLNRLEKDYQLRFFEYAENAREQDIAQWKSRAKDQEFSENEQESPWAQSTDHTGALAKIDNSVALDELSGVIFLSDGCDHSTQPASDLAHRFADKDVPIHSVIIGNQSSIKDAEVVLVQAPNQIFKGDRLTLRASIKADQLSGRETRIRLLGDGELIEERTVNYSTNRDRQTISFETEPDSIGVHEYTIELDRVAAEEVADNNTGSCRVWVSKDFIRMLVVEDRPRWEFRYLRNLFAGRDRSVFLQYVLLRPDRLAGVPDPPILHASAGRAFDDCEATALPKDPNEWLKFDVIVLGDVAPTDLGNEVLQTLEKFVKNRAGTLIVISGARSMPHKYRNTPIANLFPVELNQNDVQFANSPDTQYKFEVSPSAQTHVIMQQSTDPSENAQIWDSIPPLYWRHPLSEAKPGATVLAYAADNTGLERSEQRKRSLILWHRYGAGKVLQMCFDQTWRLRYGIGDRYHHQFWGQVLRWSISDRLAAGTELVRMGTDRGLYQSGDAITIKARLLDKNRNHVNSDDTKAKIYLGDELVEEIPFANDTDASGLMLAKSNGFKKPGKYRVEISGPTVNRLLELEQANEPIVFSEFAVAAPEPSSEMSDVVADPALANELASVSGGMVVDPSNVEKLFDGLGPKSSFHRDRWTVPLWNMWPVMVVFLSMVSLEWIWRKAVGLI